MPNTTDPATSTGLHRTNLEKAQDQLFDVQDCISDARGLVCCTRLAVGSLVPDEPEVMVKHEQLKALEVTLTSAIEKLGNALGKLSECDLTLIREPKS